MATQTTNLHLVKPAYNESGDVDAINDNMDALDSIIGSGFSTSSSITQAFANMCKKITVNAGHASSVTVATGSIIVAGVNASNSMIAIVRGSGALVTVAKTGTDISMSISGYTVSVTNNHSSTICMVTVVTP